MLYFILVQGFFVIIIKRNVNAMAFLLTFILLNEQILKQMKINKISYVIEKNHIIEKNHVPCVFFYFNSNLKK